MNTGPKKERKLVMRYAPVTAIHLGLRNYGGAVPAIAELIANAWDADAKLVELEIPFGESWTDESQIVVRDDGVGMSFDECNEKFLVVGKDRRKEGEFTTEGRPVMGRKGLGKLGCFGFAKVVEVQTVKDGRRTHFIMDFEEIEKLESSPGEDYEPEVLVDEQPTENPSGTTVIVRRIQKPPRGDGSWFRDSMARRFAVLSAEFQVLLNGEPLGKEELQYRLRFPKKGWQKETIPGFGTVEWWAGFTKQPVKYQHARGIAVISRGRMAQEPFEFKGVGGFTGQVALQYLVGEVKADGLDDEQDLVATGRSTVLWEDERARPLLDWGQRKIRELCRQWLKLRSDEHLARLSKTTNYLKLIENYPPRERKELRAFVRKVVTVPGIEEERLKVLILSVIHAYGDRIVVDLIRELNAAESPEEFTRLIAEWNVVEAIRVYESVKGKLAIIDRLEELVEAGTREVPELQKFLKENPWLLDPTWDMLEHNRSLDRVLKEHFPGAGEKGEGGQLILDFFCLKTPGLWVVVEVKRPSRRIPLGEIQTFAQYVDYLRDHSLDTTDPSKAVTVTGKLIASKFAANTRAEIERLATAKMYVVTWEELLRDAESNHRDLFRVVKDRAPREDPRVQALDSVEFEVERAAS